MDFAELEVSEGLRWCWNVWPCSGKEAEAEAMVIPLAIMCCPLSPVPDLSLLPHAPLPCAACNALLNPYARLDVVSNVWTCPFCFRLNALPPSYHHHPHPHPQHSLPAELFPTHTCVEYILPPPTGLYAIAHPHPSPLSLPPAPAFLFVLDTSIPLEELTSLKAAIAQSLSLLPDNALVGLVSFGSQVHVHDLSFTHNFLKSIVFHGERELPIDRIQELLGISCKPQNLKQGGINRFLAPFPDCAFNFTAILDELHPDFVRQVSRARPQRATGAALAIAVSLLKSCLSNTGSRILLFVGGPGTVGPGKVVNTNLEESMRTHKDLTNKSARHFYRAEKFYKGMKDCLISIGAVLDLFACSLDQVGVYEIRSAVEVSGGLLVLAETFGSDEFRISLQRLFASDSEGCLKMCFNATIEIIATQKVKICGALGPCSSTSKKSKSVSDKQIGIGGTNTWRLCTLTEKTHLAFLFEVTSQLATSSQPGNAFIIQFITKYQKCNGQMRVRVTTTARRWIDGSQVGQLIGGFDQEAAAAIVSRLVIYKAMKEDIGEVIRWLDNLLIGFASKFGDYNKEDPDSFRLSSSLSLFPQLMFYLRRSQFLQVSRNTPDETAFFWLMLNREGVTGSVVMIQPTLLSYTLDGPPVPVSLDMSSIKSHSILLFDSFFHIVVHTGLTIAQWRKLGYHEDPCHENFRKLLEAPVLHAQSLLAERNPLPKFIECDQHTSQARFLLAKLNPSVTHKSEHIGDSDFLFTDDVSLEAFIAHLQELAVKDGFL
ncbi:hypothetical protein GOP47_0003517 [Adiantum capillus-veneris]|uniref:Protein transport protein SEC23 n=1 Tax=Adiantum capillus-veneris TaxID=13818 RepID=A0A9D4VCD6_ADICA|nr:hypothetical protein GOP47_0003517 [Adiantum capillus-veneris]